MNRIFIHPDINNKKFTKNFPELCKEFVPLCKLLKEDGSLPGEAPLRYFLPLELQKKTFHAKIILPKEGIGKRQGGRIIYTKEECEIFKILYLGLGHRDKCYDDPRCLIELIQKRYQYDDKDYVPFKNNPLFKDKTKLKK